MRFFVGCSFVVAAVKYVFEEGVVVVICWYEDSRLVFGCEKKRSSRADLSYY